MGAEARVGEGSDWALTIALHWLGRGPDTLFNESREPEMKRVCLGQRFPVPVDWRGGIGMTL